MGAGDCSRGAQETPEEVDRKRSGQGVQETPEEVPERGSTNLTNRSSSPPPSFWKMLDSRVREEKRRDE
jgi:hypothetical protein